MIYKAVLKEVEPVHYVSDSDMIEFIEVNSDMVWNDICDFVREQGICSSEGDPIYWTKKDLEKPQYLNNDQIEWIGAFFEAHPWINQMMLTFDD